MAEQTLLPLTFEDVAIYFSKQEWQHLQTWQKKLYKHVMRTNYETLVSLDADLPKPELILWIEHEGEPFGSWEESQKPGNVKDSSAEAHFDPVTEQLLGDPLQGHGSSGPFLGGREDVSFSSPQGLSLVTPQRPDTLAPGAAAHSSSVSVAEGGIPSHRALGLPSWQGLPSPHPVCVESFGQKNHLGTHPVGHSKYPESSAGRKPGSQVHLTRRRRPEPCPVCGRSSQQKRYFLRNLVGLERNSPIQGRKCKVCSHPKQVLSRSPPPGKGSAPRPDLLSTGSPKDSPPWAKRPVSWRSRRCAPPGWEPMNVSFRMRASHLGPAGHQSKDALPFHCAQCEARFSLRTQLYIHQRKHRDPRRFPCSECSLAFPLRCHLQEHLRLHSGERPFQCPQCSKSFRLKCTLRYHLRLHSGERPFQCPKCPKSFCFNYILRDHLRLHSGERPFQCPKCPKSFRLKCTLRYHLSLHSGERPFQCPKCSKSFRLKGTLRNHLHMHSGERPFQCPQCLKSFRCKGALQDHQHTHSAQKPFQCLQCPRSFIRQTHLTRHLGRHSGERHVQCSVCGKSFQARADMKTYQLLHGGEMPFSCKCGKGFAKRFKLVEHIRTHIGEKPFQCSRCKKPFQCPKCNEAFRLKKQLLSHQRVHTGESPKSKLTAHVKVNTKPCPAPRDSKPDTEIKKG
ncbi:zinc finger protein 786-like isoform X3 [Perognathus longimembris pacificus]|uniref:zinc finger protein 786-like isoform X3 n=1 Tax=Perognathus longimembris pacificus TaxID=214514 RepID=UPI0020198596|nr:zinc finger protein 786-like isoform X3 [Perognathus longimembris pacificus]